MTGHRKSLRHGPASARAGVAWLLLLLAISPLALPRRCAGASAGWEPAPWGRSLRVPLPVGQAAGFDRMLPGTTGVAFSNHLALASAQQNRLLEDGSGIAAGDIDGDGLCDLYFCSLDGRNRLYRNLGGWRFEDVTSGSGVACPDQYSTGAAFADLDGDGDLDLLVNATGRGTRCFLNDGRGRFTESPRAGFATDTGARTIAVADVDGDGDLDVYVTHYRAVTAKDAPVSVRVRQVNGQWQVPPEHRERFAAQVNATGNVGILELGEPDALYLNDGHALFTRVSWTGGQFLDEQGHPLTEPPRDWGLTAMFRDMNGDGLPDLYVCNDFYTPDRIWINRGHGTFQALPARALRKTAWASMAVDFADIDRDGHDDFFLAEMLSPSLQRRQVQRSLSELDAMPAWGWGWRPGDTDARTQVMRNTLLRNRGDNTYAELANFAGVAASDWTWGVAFLDVDLDGFEDLLIANGHALDLANSDSVARLNQITDPRDPRRRTLIHEVYPRLDVPKLAFRNRGDLTFEEVGARWGFDYVGAANGMALADLDNDGDLDVVINNFDAPATLLRNRATAGRLEVRLRGAGANPKGIGARITVRGAGVVQSQEVICGGRYLSCDDAVRSFATGSGAGPMDVEVRWRSGKVTRAAGVAPNSLCEIDESRSEVDVPVVPAAPQVHFEEVSARIGHVHVDRVDDDGSTQPLLPHRLSQPGPGVSWMDLDSDGHADLVVTAGRGGTLAVLLGDGRGGFHPGPPAPWAQPSLTGQTMALGWAPEPQAHTLLVGEAAFCGAVITNRIAGFTLWAGGIDPLPVAGALPFTLGAIAAADYDGDGDLDLFVGGRAIPGRYPESAPSLLLRNDGGRWVPDQEAAAAWKALGLVNAAVWSDLDNDGLPELITACEWGPVRVWTHRGGRWEERTASLGLDAWTGWWNGVATVDLDGDGRLDIVASNWGRNTRRQEFVAGELRLFHGDLDGNGTLDLVEAVVDPRRQAVVPFRDRRFLLRGVPALGQRFDTYARYAQATAADLLDGVPAVELRARTLDSMVFFNRGDRMSPVPLPPEAQWAPAFGVAVADFDGDGAEDIFLSQNFFAQDPELGREDSGRGLWLRGDGRGSLIPVAGQRSGIRIHGEQRGCAVADFDEDGRPDLAVGENAGPTHLFRNTAGRAGLRVVIDGPAGNRSGIGTKLRILPPGDPAATTPVREVRCGGGYWSQDSPVQILALPASGPRGRLWVQWPGGRQEIHPIPAAAVEVRLVPGHNPEMTR